MSDTNDAPPARSKGTLETLVEQLSRTLEMFRGSHIDTAPWSPAEHGRLVDFDGLEGYEEVDRYWLNAPFSFADRKSVV